MHCLSKIASMASVVVMTFYELNGVMVRAFNTNHNVQSHASNWHTWILIIVASMFEHWLQNSTSSIYEPVINLKDVPSISWDFKFVKNLKQRWTNVIHFRVHFVVVNDAMRLTCNNVKFVWAAIARFSSSVG